MSGAPRTSLSTCLRGGLIVTMNDQRETFLGDLRIEDEKIVEIAPSLAKKPGELEVDARGCFVIPGLIQIHTHLCQTLFRGLADDLELLDWLQEKIWPFEKAHTAASLKAAARVGLLEMQSLGTTAIVDMGTTFGADFLFEEAEQSGIRYYGGNCFMDLKSASGPLYRPLDESMREAETLIAKWHKKTPLLEYLIAPRFAVCCTEKMMKAGVALQKKHGCLLHTHASENRGEIALIKKRTGRGNIDYLNDLGLLTEQSIIAHCVHLTKAEAKKMAEQQAAVAHCPGSNMKLASGFAPIPEYLRLGMKVGLGADGAACNNTLDPFLEMRLAGLIHKPKFGPRALPAHEVFALATLGGASALGRSQDLGSLEAGKLADVVVVDRSHPSIATVDNPYSALVYSCSGRDVRDVWTHGQPIVRDRKHFRWTWRETMENARTELGRLLVRASLG